MKTPPLRSWGAVTILGILLAACATGQDLRETSKKFEDQTETVRSTLEAKLAQMNRTQREAEKTIAELKLLMEDTKKEQNQTRELAAKLGSDLRTIREMDLTKVEGRIERAKRDIETLQSKVEDQVVSLQQNAQQWLATLDQKQTSKLDQQVARVDQQVGKVEARLETLDKREAAASTRIQDTLTTLGKKIDERQDAQDRRIDSRIKKVEDDGVLRTKNLSDHLTEVDKSLKQMSETMKKVGGQLSAQVDQHSAALAKLEESTKQSDAQIQGRVDQTKSSVAELSKTLRLLSEKSAEIERRVADLNALTAQGAEQSAKLDKLTKRMDVEGQAVAQHLNTVTQSVNGFDGRIEALTKSLNATMATVNESTRALADLKQVLEVSVGKLASRVDEQGDVLNRVVQQLQGAKQTSSAPDMAPVDSQRASSANGGPKVEALLSPETAYERAYQEFQQSQFDHALASFRNFLSQYPDSTLVPNAHFWIAECYVRKRDYPHGIESYDQVIRHYPKSAKASIALYRKALVLLEMHDKNGAKNALKKLMSDYPKSEESKQAKAKLAALQ